MLALFLGVFSNALLARLLSPAELGTYFLALSLVSVCAMAGCLGLTRSVVRFVAENMGLSRFGRTRQVVGVILVLGVLGSLCVSAVYFLVGDAIVSRLFNAPALAAITGLMAGWIVVSALQDLLNETFRGFKDIRLATLFGGVATNVNSAGLISKILLVACLFLLWQTRGQTDLSTILLIILGAGSISILAAAWLLRGRVASLEQQQENQDKEKPVALREVLQVSMPLLVTNLTLFLLSNQSDIWIMSAFRAQEEVAIYGAAARLVALVTMPLLVINAVLSPFIAELYAQGRRATMERAIRTATTVAGIPSLLVLVAFASAGGVILGLVYGDYYREGAMVLAILSLGKLANVWSGACGIVLQMTGHQTLMMWINILTGIIFVGGAVWAVQSYGAVGVAGVAALSLTLQNVATVLAAKKKVGIWTHLSFSIAPFRDLLNRRR